jgi:hypothetical protein
MDPNYQDESHIQGRHSPVAASSVVFAINPIYCSVSIVVSCNDAVLGLEKAKKMNKEIKRLFLFSLDLRLFAK